MNADEIKPGDVRRFKQGDGNAVVLTIGLWAQRQGTGIQIHITGIPGHTTVTNNVGSERYHRTLFRDLRRVLVEHDCWLFGGEGAETEDVRIASARG